MQTRSDLEYRITEKLRTLPATALQWLSEDIALIRDPKRYRNLYGQGRNAEAQTTKGWPDAYVVKSDGTVDGVEATRDRQTWTTHLEEDIKKAKSPYHPNLNGYLFVAGYPDHDPTPQELSRWKLRLCKAGISEDRVDLLVGKGLVAELLKPQYARTLQTILGLSPSPEHFSLIRQEQFPNNIDRPFEPNVTEYREGLVHRPALATEVEHRLRTDGCALIRGRGAAGKTVLAYLVAASREYRVLPSYYLNLAPWMGQVEYLRGKIDNTLVEFGGEGVLFIVDNVHLEEAFAFDVFRAWRGLARLQGTRLLLLGRETRRRAGSGFDGADIASLILRAGVDDVRGVYYRLARRELRTLDRLPEPNDEAVRSWTNTFGGNPDRPNSSVDLMAFSAAARNRMQYLSRGDWQLDARHAREEVRKEYLSSLGEEERSNLLRLAALPDDCLLVSEALAAPYIAFDVCTKKGIVFETEHGTDRRVRYSLAHPSLGSLLLAAANPLIDPKAECCRAANLSAFVGFVIARRATQEADEELARLVYQAIAENPDWLRSISTLQHLPDNVRKAKAAGIDLLPTECTDEAHVQNAISDLARKTELHFLVTFLNYAKSTDSGLLKLHDALIADMIQHPTEFAERARKTALGDLATFLIYTKSTESGLQKLNQVLASDMIQHANVFVQRARKTDLHFLVSFLTFAQSKESGLQKLHHALVADMIQHATEYAQRARKTALGDLATFLIYTKSTESGLQKLNHALVADMTQHATEFAQRARKTDLHFLITFLAYAKSRENGLLKLHNTLVADMVQHATEFIGRAREAAFGVLVAFLTYTKSKQNGLLKLHDTLVADMIQHATEFAERARKTAFGELVNLLTYTKSAENGLLNFHDTLIVDMVQHATEFADHACEVPINQLVTFLTYVRSEFRDSRIASAKDFAQDVCDAIDLKAWNYRRANERPQQPNFVLNTKRLLTELGRAELLFPVARNLIRAADQRAWHGPAIGIHHLSSIMQESAHQERDHLVRFLDRIVLPEWLDRNYSQANQGSLAASWFAIATNLPCEFHSRFVTPGLQARLDQDLAAALFESTDIGTNVFSMIGSAALLGATPNSSDIRWPNSQILDQMMKLRRSTDETLNSRQMQFWCGLREMARLQTDAVKVPCSEARPILVSWKNLSPRTPFAIAFNASMIAWLETSEASNWNLARCNEQVRDDIIARICEA